MKYFQFAAAKEVINCSKKKKNLQNKFLTQKCECLFIDSLAGESCSRLLDKLVQRNSIYFLNDKTLNITFCLLLLVAERRGFHVYLNVFVSCYA